METLIESPNALSESCLTEPRAWNLTASHPCSISGVELDGEKPVRLVYMDESGLSQESVLVVAGVIIHPDTHWRLIEAHVAELIEKYVPVEHRNGFVFHAKDLFHGTGRTLFDRRAFPLAKSREALKELLAIPSKFHLPVPYGYIRKKTLADIVKPKNGLLQNVGSLEHAVAFAMCAVAAEHYMRIGVDDPEELATLIAENNTQTGKAVTQMHRILRGQVEDSEAIRVWYSTLGHDDVPLRKIISSVSLKEKNDDFILQLADACALAIRYFIEDKPNVEEFLNAFTQGNLEKIGNKKQIREHDGRGVILF